MTSSPPGPVRSGDLRALSTTLVAGAVYDFVFAGLMLAAPGVLARLFALPLPGEAFYLRLIGVLLVIVGGAYLIAARDPGAQRPLVALAIAGRTAGFAALGLSALGRPQLAGLWLPAFGDLLFALLHAVTARRLWR